MSTGNGHVREISDRTPRNYKVVTGNERSHTEDTIKDRGHENRKAN